MPNPSSLLIRWAYAILGGVDERVAEEGTGDVLLAIDVGNTNIVLGVFEGERVAASWRIATDRRKMPDEIGILVLSLLSSRKIEPTQIDAVGISSVVPPLTAILREMAEIYFHVDPLVVEPGIKTGVAVRYENPREVGADRIVNAVAAIHYYGAPAVVVDFGTATTFDAINSRGEYLGGSIAPGINIAAEALFAIASRLYRVELSVPPLAIGRNTAASMQSGIMFGYIGLVEGLVARFKQEMIQLEPHLTPDKIKVVATGGLAAVVAQESNRVIDVIDQDLTLQGLRLIVDMN